MQKLLAECVAKMPEIEKTVLSLYYYEEMTLREISKIVRLHESRISQLKSQAVLRLRAAMERQWPTQRGCRLNAIAKWALEEFAGGFASAIEGMAMTRPGVTSELLAAAPPELGFRWKQQFTGLAGRRLRVG